MIKYVAPLVAAAVVVALGTAPLASAHAPASCTPHQLPGAPGASGMGEVMLISDAGMYVGDVADTDGSFRATWWTHTGADLATGWTVHMVPGVPADSVVNDVNGYGVMVGAAFDSSQSFIYDSRSGALTWLPELPGGSWTWGRRINASGEVSGGAGDKHGGELATVWLPPYTAATKLPNVGASQSIGTQDLAHDHMFSEADGLNDAGIASGVTSLGGRVQDPSFAARNGFWRGGIAPLLAPIEWRANGRPYRLRQALTRGTRSRSTTRAPRSGGPTVPTTPRLRRTGCTVKSTTWAHRLTSCGATPTASRKAAGPLVDTSSPTASTGRSCGPVRAACTRWTRCRATATVGRTPPVITSGRSAASPRPTQPDPRYTRPSGNARPGSPPS